MCIRDSSISIEIKKDFSHFQYGLFCHAYFAYAILETESVLAKGLCERIGIDGSLTYQPSGKDKIKKDKPMPTHSEAIAYVIDALTDAENGVIKSLNEIDAVGPVSYTQLDVYKRQRQHESDLFQPGY